MIEIPENKRLKNVEEVIKSSNIELPDLVEIQSKPYTEKEKENVMRVFAILVNIIAILVILLISIITAFDESIALLVGLLLLIYPSFHIWVLLYDPTKTIYKNSWLVLYLKRKSLEEKKRIEKLESSS